MVSNNKFLDEVIQTLTKQMIINNFQNKKINEEKYIITKQELYEFSIKLIRLVKEVYENDN
jgi:uncharacterized protein (UPF0305 family)